MNILFRLLYGKSPRQAAHDFLLKVFEHLTRNLGEKMYIETAPDRIVAHGYGDPHITLYAPYGRPMFKATIFGHEGYFSRLTFRNEIKYQSYHLNPEELHKSDPRAIAEDLFRVMSFYRKIEPLVEPVYQDAKEKSNKIWEEAGDEIDKIIQAALATQ